MAHGQPCHLKGPDSIVTCMVCDRQPPCILTSPNIFQSNVTHTCCLFHTADLDSSSDSNTSDSDSDSDAVCSFLCAIWPRQTTVTYTYILTQHFVVLDIQCQKNCLTKGQIRPFVNTFSLIVESCPLSFAIHYLLNTSIAVGIWRCIWR